MGSSGGKVSVAAAGKAREGPDVTTLSPLDLQVINLLAVHRVLTTTQLIAITGRAERTIDYRLSRLLEQRFVARTRPYRDSGSAPFHWWLTAAGTRLATGDVPKAFKASPNPLFVAHATATAGVWIALAAGAEVVEWRREEAAWEEWSTLGKRHCVAPDALVVLRLDVDGEVADAHAFVEVDMGTMTQRRLAAKVARYLAYAKDRAWEGRHPHCPALLVLTTSEERATTFLAGVVRQQPAKPR